MSTSHPIRCSSDPAKSPPSDPPMIRARRSFVSFTAVMVALLLSVGSGRGTLRKPADSLQNCLPDRTGRLSADELNPADVEMGHALDAVIMGGAFERAHAVDALVRVEEGGHRVAI